MIEKTDGYVLLSDRSQELHVSISCRQ